MTRIPTSEQQLLKNADAIAGSSLGELAEQHGIAVPDNLNREKGWIGLLLETVLGAHAGSLPLPDFPDLGIELKTLPINASGKPLETTFVCVAPLTGFVGETWQSSHVCNKLKKVLWVPIISERHIPIRERIVCTPFLWQPNAEEDLLLSQDWQELTDMIAMGEVEKINARVGQVMQLRPKAANSKAKTQAFDKHGKPFMTLPRGFYLKIPFTHQILLNHLRVN
ncbi:DNA mismatch repair endonuclease MutH [Thalassotalea ponticola]|uniref:DNA mismatch repair endonuclease MutH n=1 Tax=Thalassotalea ponticola TaxID=1523392 RepID=UPI0025B3C513|nr:DNA mismatch repair endonuclease MutH [Thalassotalea ponticola]MDN3651720.1 DNA mismatch repair endonuclease MutH [Thalassotalea ponticola]